MSYSNITCNDFIIVYLHVGSTTTPVLPAAASVATTSAHDENLLVSDTDVSEDEMMDEDDPCYDTETDSGTNGESDMDNGNGQQKRYYLYIN
jgi:hypothetical protein